MLDDKYPYPQVQLRAGSDFTFLVAVVLSAQCTDKKVNIVTPKLFEVADTPEKMAKLSVTTIEEIIKPCGIFRNKARNIKKLSKQLVEKFGSRVPKTFEELESLAGVGHKTASVVLMQRFGIATFPVDTHIHRLASYWKLSNGKSVKQTEEDLKKLYDEKDWAKLHIQMILYGRDNMKLGR